MTHLIVDMGNTSVKVALMREGEAVARATADDFSTALLEQIPGPIDRAIVSSTRGDGRAVAETLKQMGIPTLLFTPSTPVPIEIGYLTPETLGRDRVAAAVGAVDRYPEDDLLIIDCGTAVTVDRVERLPDGGHRFVGGFISPGAWLRFRALNDYTAALPLLGPEGWEEEASDAPGRTTAEAVKRGVMTGLQMEIEGHIETARRKNQKIRVIFTGGEAKYFVKRIKNTIFANRDLVFAGLDRILAYNLK